MTTYPARAARKASGLTLTEAARRIGVTPGHLLGMEAGRSLWPYRRAELAARLYGVGMLTFTRPGRTARGRRRGVAATSPAPTAPRPAAETRG